MTRCAMVLSLVLLAGCGSQPPVPEWRMNAHGALERYAEAWLVGDTRVAQAEFLRARSALSATGDTGLVARAELTRCALQLASLVMDPCVGFDALRPDAPPAERAYADYLAGRALPPDVPLLPAAHRPIAGGAGGAAALAAIADPQSRLVAAGVLLRSGRADPPVLQAAVDTASAQGWRRPLLAWLGVQLRRAEQAGADEEAGRLRRRIALAAGNP